MIAVFKTSAAIVTFLGRNPGSALITTEGVQRNDPCRYWVQMPDKSRLKCDGRAARAAWKKVNSVAAKQSGLGEQV